MITCTWNELHDALDSVEWISNLVGEPDEVTISIVDGDLVVTVNSVEELGP